MIREEFYGDDWLFSFVVYRPNEMTDNLPLVVQLHGAGEVGDTKEELYKVDIYGFSSILKEGMEYPCVFVFPQCKTESFWTAEIPNIYLFIQAIKEKYLIDEKRIYLTGISMGGYGTWYTALRYPEFFAAIAPVCGGGMVWKAYALDMSVWAFHGTDDEVVYPSESMNMIHKMRSMDTNKNEIKLTMLDGVGHNAHDFAYTVELLDWLLSKSR